jgi:hypothetical protein
MLSDFLIQNFQLNWDVDVIYAKVIVVNTINSFVVYKILFENIYSDELFNLKLLDFEIKIPKNFKWYWIKTIPISKL